MNTTTVVLSIVAAAAVFSLALAPIGHAYAAAPVAAAAPVEADGNGDGGARRRVRRRRRRRHLPVQEQAGRIDARRLAGPLGPASAVFFYSGPRAASGAAWPLPPPHLSPRARACGSLATGAACVAPPPPRQDGRIVPRSFSGAPPCACMRACACMCVRAARGLIPRRPSRLLRPWTPPAPQSLPAMGAAATAAAPAPPPPARPVALSGRRRRQADPAGQHLPRPHGAALGDAAENL